MEGFLFLTHFKSTPVLQKKKHSGSSLFFSSSGSPPFSAQPTVSAGDYAVLTALYAAFGNPVTLSRWSISNQPCSSYPGLTCGTPLPPLGLTANIMLM